MTNEAWETLSNQAIAAAGVVYFLSLLAYLVQWASLRHVPAAGLDTRSLALAGLDHRVRASSTPPSRAGG